MVELFFNPIAKKYIKFSKLTRNPLEFHRKIQGYKPTPLISSQTAASTLGFDHVWVKSESDRYGLPAFKILGASWAIYNEVAHLINIDINDWADLNELKGLVKKLGKITLVTATDGNHGRAVARVAKWFGMQSKIYIPSASAASRINAIKSEGAEVILVKGDYDLAVELAAKESNQNSWVIQDTAYKNYSSIPERIVEGYSTIYWELEEQFKDINRPIPDLIVIQIGVGSLASSLVNFYRHTSNKSPPKIIGVEPEGAESGLKSIKNGRIVTTPGPYSSIMAGMNCGTISYSAIKYLKEGINAFVSVSNEKAVSAMRILARDGIKSGETGCAGLAGLLEIKGIFKGSFPHEKFGIDEKSDVLVISTEGITDPEKFKEIVG